MLQVYAISALPTTLEGLKSYITPAYNFHCLLINNLSLVGKVNIYNYDVLLIDDSSQDIQKLKSFFLSLTETSYCSKTIIYTESNDGAYLANLACLGVKGLLHKKSTKEKIYESLEYVKAGMNYIDQHFFTINRNLEFKLTLSSLISDVKCNTHLSQREQEVLNFIAEGFANRDIAQKMDLKVKTVENYKERIKEKFGVKSIQEVYDLYL